MNKCIKLYMYNFHKVYSYFTDKFHTLTNFVNMLKIKVVDILYRVYTVK